MRAFILRLCLFTFLLAMTAEAFFRWVMPASNGPLYTQDEEFKIIIYDTELARDGMFTVGRYAQHRARWHVNEAGWNSADSFLAPDERDRPALVMIGDSYVEGFTYDRDEPRSLSRLVDVGLEERYAVYPLGHSGSTLSQTILVARYAAHHFDPEVLVVVVTHGMLRHSLRNFATRNFDLQLLVEDDSITELAPAPFRPSRWLRIPRISATVRFLQSNVGLKLGARALVQEDARSARDLSADLPLLTRAADHIVGTLRRENPDRRILFVIDADRKALYDSPDSVVAELECSRPLEVVCADHDCGFIDLTEGFAAHWRSQGERFDYPYDYHWNLTGVSVVASGIVDALEGTMPRP